MDTFLLGMAGIVITVPAAILVMMFFLKGANAHNERMLREQEQLDRKNGVVPKPDSPENTGAKKRRGTERVMVHLPSILTVVVGAAAIYWGFQNTQIGPADAGSWGRNHWLPLLTLWCAGAILVSINAPEKTKPSLQWTLAGMMFMFFIGFSIIGWFGGSSNSPEQKRTVEQVVRSTPAVVPLVTAPKSAWSRLSIEAGGRGDIQLPFGMHHAVVDGEKYRPYTMYADGSECSTFGKETCHDGTVIGYYVINEATEKNVIIYAFVPQ